MAKKKKAKAAKKKIGSARPVGKMSKVGVIQTWIKLFQTNEKATKAKRMTDAQISKAMLKEFPGRTSKTFLERSVHGIRGRYNTGGLTKQIVPKVQSYRYDKDGNTIEGRVRGQSEGGSRTGKKKAVRRVRAKVKRAKAVTA